MSRTPKPWFRKSTGWWMTEICGRQIKLARGKECRKEAQVRFHELMVECAANPPVDGGAPTVASIIDAYLDQHQRAVGERTYYEHRRLLQKFAEAYGNRHVKDCLPFHLSSWLDQQKRWKSKSTRSTVINAVQASFNWAATQKLIASNPFKGVYQRDDRRRRPMTKEEFQKILVVAGKSCRRRYHGIPSGQRLQHVLFFCRFTGCRPSEARNLKWTDLEHADGYIVLKEHKTVGMSTDPDPRAIPLVWQVKRLLGYLRKKQPHGEYVFVCGRRTKWARGSLPQKLKRIRKIAGIPGDAVLYGVRHRFATSAVENGVHLSELAGLLGHKSTRTTGRYVHVSNPRLADAMTRAVCSRPDA